ncbi:MAG: ribonuclease HII [Lachnospiraceae bacterium]|nr:ribonuclease HII [Lachnospiraceae bacterium]MBP5254022.1 ribonuclease HII [Lachnospiraceae bacterium]
MESIRAISEYLKQTPYEALAAAIASFEPDTRPGAVRVLDQYRKKLAAYRQELARLDRMMLYERKYADLGVICGIDEAGRGPLAGPVAAAAVILPKDHPILYVNDSKKLTPARREELYGVIMKEAVSVGVGIVSETVIDEINILQATYRAMAEAFSKLSPRPACTLNDAVTIPGIPVRQVPIVRGDAKSASIAAASVIAKVTRDRMMEEYDRLYPEYGFRENKGYGTAAHMDAIRAYGPCPIHRRTFIRSIIGDAHE